MLVFVQRPTFRVGVLLGKPRMPCTWHLGEGCTRSLLIPYGLGSVYISFSGGCRPQRLPEPGGTRLALCYRFPQRAGTAGLPGSALQRELLAAQREPLLFTCGSAQPRPHFCRRDCLESVHTDKSCSQQTPSMLGKSPSSMRAREHCFLRIFLSIYFLLVISKAMCVIVRKALFFYPYFG